VSLSPAQMLETVIRGGARSGSVPANAACCRADAHVSEASTEWSGQNVCLDHVLAYTPLYGVLSTLFLRDVVGEHKAKARAISGGNHITRDKEWTLREPPGDDKSEFCDIKGTLLTGA